MKDISSIFFDLDDTLIDHKGAERKALFAIKRKYFPTIDDEQFEKIWLEKTKKNWQLFTEKKLGFEEQRTNRIIDVWDYFKAPIAANIGHSIFLEYLKYYEQYWSIFSDVIPTLQHLTENNIDLGIITNGNPQQQLKKLSQVGILHFFDTDQIIISEEVGFSKPSLEIFNFAQKIKNRSAKNLLFVGDNFATDIEPARTVGWNALLINRSLAASDNTTIYALDDLLKII